jgi:hypothetical protein
MKVCRLRRLNVAEAGANKANNRQSPVEQVGRPEQREQHRPRLSNLHRSRSMVVHQYDDQARSQAPGKVNQDRIPLRGTTNVYGSARRRLREQLNTGNLAAVHSPDFTSRSRRRLVEDLRMKRAPNEKECRALTHSRRPSISTSSSSNEAARLRQPIMPRGTGSRKVETRDNQKKRHRPGRDNLAQEHQRLRNVKLRSRFC